MRVRLGAKILGAAMRGPLTAYRTRRIANTSMRRAAGPTARSCRDTPEYCHH